MRDGFLHGRAGRQAGAGHSSAEASIRRGADKNPVIIGAMGFNPFRAQKRRRSDYVFLAAAFAVTLALLVWAIR